MIKKLKILLVIVIIFLIGFICYKLFIDNKKVETIKELPKITFKNITFSLLDNYIYINENDQMYLSDNNIEKYAIALDISKISAKKIYENQNNYKDELTNNEIIVNKNFNYSSDNYEFTGYEVSYLDENSLYFFVDIDDNITLYGNIILKDNSISYEDVLDDLNIILLYSKSNTTENIYDDIFITNMPAYNDGINIIPFEI